MGFWLFYGSNAYAESARSYVFDNLRLANVLAWHDCELHSGPHFGGGLGTRRCRVKGTRREQPGPHQCTPFTPALRRSSSLKRRQSSDKRFTNKPRCRQMNSHALTAKIGAWSYAPGFHTPPYLHMRPAQAHPITHCAPRAERGFGRPVHGGSCGPVRPVCKACRAGPAPGQDVRRARWRPAHNQM